MLEKDKVIDIVKNALKEDIGKIDLTTSFLIPPEKEIRAAIVSKSKCVVAGLPLVEIAYGLLDKNLRIGFNVREGAGTGPGKAVCYLEGRASSILKGERVALNFLSRTSGIATITKAFVDKAKPYNVEIFDTRKTAPNLRYIEKYAVKAGGGRNHRMGLYDQILIKDNHLAALSGLKDKLKNESIIEYSVRIAKKKAQKNVKIEVEVNSIAEFQEAIGTEADIIMLDNMPPGEVTEAVKIRNAGGVKARRVILEASGNIDMNNIEEYAKTGVDRISIGSLTHSPSIIDFSLDIL